MPSTKMTLVERREFLKSVFDARHGSSIFDRIEVAVHAFSDTKAEVRQRTGLEFPIPNIRSTMSAARVAG